MRASRRLVDERRIRSAMPVGDEAHAAVWFALVRGALVGRRHIFGAGHFVQSPRGVLRSGRRPGSRFGGPDFERRPGQRAIYCGWTAKRGFSSMPGAAFSCRFGEAKAKFESLDAIAITHLHADHVSDLPALLKSGFFGDRQRPLPIIGPSGGDVFPGIKEFMHALFDPEGERFDIYQAISTAAEGWFAPISSKWTLRLRRQRLRSETTRFKLTAIGVEHGPVPALGYLVEVRGRRIAFAGDQNGDNPAFAAMIKGVDILVMDHAVPEMADPVARQLHARPSEIGLLAAHAGVKQLVLSHNMARSLGPLKENLALIRQTLRRSCQGRGRFDVHRLDSGWFSDEDG